MVTNKLAKLMEREDISILELQAATGISRQSILKWKYSKPVQYRAKTIAAFCKHFDIPINALLILEDDYE